MAEQTTEFTLVCPHCGQHLSAELDWVGVEMECPTCGKTLIVPHPDSIKQNKSASGKSQQSTQQFNDNLKNNQKSKRFKRPEICFNSKTNESQPKTQRSRRKSTLAAALIVFALIGFLYVFIICVGVYFWSRYVKGQEEARAEEMRREKAAKEQRQMEAAARFLTQVIGAGLENAQQQQRAEEERKAWNSFSNPYRYDIEEQKKIYYQEMIRDKARRNEKLPFGRW